MVKSPVGSDYHLWAKGTGRGNSVNRAPGELSYGEGLPDRSCPCRAGHHSGKGVEKETPNLSLLPPSDLLVLPMGRSQPESEGMGARRGCPYFIVEAPLGHRVGSRAEATGQ